MSITQILVEKGLLTPAQLDEAVALQQAQGLRVDRAIIQLGFLTELQLLEVMAGLLHLPLVNLAEVSIDPETLQALPSKVVYRKRLVPISRTNARSTSPRAMRSISTPSTTSGS